MNRKLIIISVFMLLVGSTIRVSAETNINSNSLEYADKLGSGWNLGNTFDSFDTNGDKGEESWGNPLVTRPLLKEVKSKGFDSIRIPFTTEMRIGDKESNYKIEEDFLLRYKEVVDWALEEDLYVMINLHHDSWAWLAEWDGSILSDQYIKFGFIWEQLAEVFQGYDERLMFESINEPQFWATDSQKALNNLNDLFYKIVRGDHPKRMLVIPSVNTDTNQESLNELYEYITNLDDENILATVHYYSEWVYSANLGITEFEEDLWGDGTSSPRKSLEETFARLKSTFIDKGIGVLIGEYGLLAYDKSDDALQMGETLKFIDATNAQARKNGLNLFLWDNGQHLNRLNDGKTWQNQEFGSMIESSIKMRSAHPKALNTIYINKNQVIDDLVIDIIADDMKLLAIKEDQTIVLEENYNYKDGVLTLNKDYVEEIFNSEKILLDKIKLELEFDQGSPLNLYIARTDSTLLFDSKFEKGKDIKIETQFSGNDLKRISSKNSQGENVSPQSWWNYLEMDVSFSVEKDSITLLSPLTELMNIDETYHLEFEFYDGTIIDYYISNGEGYMIGTVLVDYKDFDNNKLLDSTEISGRLGSEVEIEIPVIEGMINNDINTSITIKNNLTRVTIIYDKQVKDEDDDQIDDDQIDEDQIDDDQIGEDQIDDQKNDEIAEEKPEENNDNKEVDHNKDLPMTGMNNHLFVVSLSLILGGIILSRKKNNK